MIEKILTLLGYSTEYFISYVGQNRLYGSARLTVKPYICSKNFEEARQKVNELAGCEVAITCISKL